MRNKLIEKTIDEVVDKSEFTVGFKIAFKQYIKNKFDNNASESDLKRILTLMDDSTEETMK